MTTTTKMPRFCKIFGHDRETLAAVHKVLRYANCNDLASDEVVAMLLKVEAELRKANA